jgi:hypothetical protein
MLLCRSTDESGHPLSFDLSASQGAVLIGWSGPITGPFVTVHWMARIESCRLVGKETIKLETGIDPTSSSVYYLLFKLDDIVKLNPRDVSSLVAAANASGEGGRFRAFQSSLVEVCRQKLASIANE